MRNAENKTAEERLRQTILSAQTYAAREVSVDTVLKGLADGLRQAWDFDSYVVVTSIVSYETFSRLRIDYISGDMPEDSMQKGLAILEDFAAKVGCQGVEVIGRQGWVRKLRPFGYEQQYAVVIKGLNHE